MALSLRISIEWVKRLSDGNTCRDCQQPIRGWMYQMELITGEEREMVNHRLCQPCYQATSDGNNKKTD